MRSWKPHGGKVHALAFSPDGTTLATASGQSQYVTFWDAFTGTESGRVGGSGARVGAFEFSPDGRHLAALDAAGGVLVWDAVSDRTVPVARLVPAGITVTPSQLLTFAPNGRLVAAGAAAVNWWDDATAPGKAVRQPTGYWGRDFREAPIYAVRFTPDGSRLLIGRDDLEIWDAAMTRTVVVVRTKKGGGLRAIAVSPDGERAAVRLKNTVRVCRLTKAAWETTLHWGSEMVYAVAFSRAGRRLLTAGADGTVRFWDTDSWREVRSFDWGIGKVHVVAFAPDGLTCAAGGEKGQVVVWDVE